MCNFYASFAQFTPNIQSAHPINSNKNDFGTGASKQNTQLLPLTTSPQNQQLREVFGVPNSASHELPPDVLKDIWEVEQKEKRIVTYNLPSYKTVNPQTAAYYSAFQKISEMLANKKPLDLKKAMFLVENAYFNNTMSWDKYNKTIQDKANLCLQLMKQKGLPDNAHNRKMAIFSLMSDTLKFKNAGLEKTQIHFPYQYDFQDFYGNKDWSKQFVSKLLTTKKGQCHSMPLLYLILAQELGVTAYLSTAPEHYYVRIKDQNGDLQNLELTNGMFTTNSFVLASGFIKTEALKNKMYMDSLDLKKQVASCLVDLAQGYCRKFGFDDFIAQCTDKTLEVHPNNLHAILVKSDYYTTWFMYLQQKLGIKDLAATRKHPQAMQVLKMRNQIYQLTDNLGFEKMPEESYKAWLGSLKDAAQQQQSAEIRKTIHLNEIK